MALARVKNWTTEVLTASDLNAEFNSILNNVSSLICPIGFHLTFTDATYDIGASGATRPRNGYFSGNITIGSGQLGAWTTPTFSAGDYTASGSQTWTVASGDVTTMEYTIINKLMIVNWLIQTTTVGGTPATYLQIAIPASKTATKLAVVNTGVIDNGSPHEVGLATVAAAGTVIKISRNGGANWSAATNTTEVFGHMAFEID